MRAFTGILAITVLCLSAPKLCAQTPALPDQVDPIDTMPLRFGPLGVTPTLAITNFGIDSNIFNDASDPRSDFTTTVTPRVLARLRRGRTLLTGSIASGLVYYQKYSDERSIDYATDGRVDVDLGWFRPYASAQRLDTRERLNAELDIRAPRVSTNLAAGAHILATPLLGFTFDAKHVGVTFDPGTTFEGVELSNTLDSDQTTIQGGVEVYVTPLTTLSVIGSRQEDRFPLAPERDANSFTLMPTVKLEAPAIIQGTFGIGYRSFDGLAPEMPDYTGLVFRGTLSHTFFERTKADLTLMRDVQYSFEVEEPYYLTTGIRATLTHQLLEAVDIRGVISRDRLEYRQQAVENGVDNRVDRLHLMSAGVGYRFSAYLRVGVDIEYARRLSDREDRKYDRTRVLGSATYGF